MRRSDWEVVFWFSLAFVLVLTVVYGCSAPAADPSVGFESFPVTIISPAPTGEIDVPLTSAPWECGIPEGCGTLPPTDGS